MKLGTYMMYRDKLQGEYIEAFEFVENYADIHMISGHYKNEKLMDLIDLMMQAQENGAQVETIIGKNREQFAKDFYSDVTLINLCEDFFSKLKNWVWLILIFETVEVISIMGDAGFNFFTIKTELSGYFMGFIIAYLGMLVADIISIILAKFKYYNQKVTIGLMIGCTVVTIGMCIYMVSCGIKIRVRNFPVFICAIIFLAIYYAVTIGYRLKKTGTVKKIKDDYDTTFTGLVKAELDNQTFDKKEDLSYLKTISRRYAKKNKKRINKGKEPLTTREYLEKENKMSKYAFSIGCFLGISISAIVTLLNHGFASIGDAVIFAAIMCVIFILVYRFERSVEKVNENQMNTIIFKCEERKVEMDELYEQILSEIEENN